jgi:hypothetical protein
LIKNTEMGSQLSNPQLKMERRRTGFEDNAKKWKKYDTGRDGWVTLPWDLGKRKRRRKWRTRDSHDVGIV